MSPEEVAARIAEVDARSKSNKHRIDDLERRQTSLERLTELVCVMQNEQENIKEDVTEIKDDVKLIMGKPAQRWESVVERIITVAVGAMVGFLLSGGQML